MKKLTLTADNISQKQWSNLILELNIMKRMWKSYGVKVDLKTHSLNRIIAQGTSNGENKTFRRHSK